MSFRKFSGGARSHISSRSGNINTGLEVLSDNSGGSGDFSRSRLGVDWRTAPGDRAMSEVSSYQSYQSDGISELQLSVDVNTCSTVHDRGYHLKPFKLHLKSTVSTLLTLLMLIIGIILVALFKTKDQSQIRTNGFIAFSHIIRAAGLFGFAGGVTNWIGIQVIFNKVPELFCRGYLSKKFTVSREMVANFLLKTFFSPLQVRQHVRDKVNVYMDPDNFDKELQDVLNSNVVSLLIEQKLDSLMSTPQGLTLRNLGLSRAKLRTVVKRYVLDMKSFASPLLLSSFQSMELIDPDRIREQIVDLIATRTQQMTAEQVKQFVDEALYKHALWLVLWGNVFGALVGCIIEIASIYTRNLPW